MANLSPDIRLSANFTVGEFQARSKRTLTDADLPQLRAWVDSFLQPLRRQVGPIEITSYVRPADVGRAHENGGGVDFVTADMERAFQWAATYLPHTFGRLIHERNHLHVARRGPEAWAGQGVVLREPIEGQYELASIAIIPLIPAGVIASSIQAVTGATLTESLAESTAVVVNAVAWSLLLAFAGWVFYRSRRNG